VIDLMLPRGRTVLGECVRRGLKVGRAGPPRSRRAVPSASLLPVSLPWLAAKVFRGTVVTARA